MENIYVKSRLDFDNEEFLYHYTNFEALKLIVASKRLRLSNLSLISLNDQLEQTYLNPFWLKKVFIISFSNKISNVLWDKYANTESGICISLKNQNLDKLTCYDNNNYKFNPCHSTNFNHTSYNNNDDWGIYDVSGLKVIYVSNPYDYKIIDKDIIGFFQKCINIDKKELINSFSNIDGEGFIKEKYWDEEDEYRLRVTVRPLGKEQYFKQLKKYLPIPPFDYIFLDISSILKNISIYVKPGFNEIDELNRICSENGIILNIINI